MSHRPPSDDAGSDDTDPDRTNSEDSLSHDVTPRPDDGVDAALSAMLAGLPRTVAPSGFRARVLGAIAEDAGPLVGPTDDSASDVPIAPAAAPVPPSRWRRAAAFVGGLAVTAAALGGVAVLYSSTTDGAAEMAVLESTAEPLPSFEPGAVESDADETPFRPTAPSPRPRRFDAPPRAFADSPDGLGMAPLAANTAPPAAMRGGAAFSRQATRRAVAAPRFTDAAAVRVVRVQSPSILSNQLAVRQFEAAAVRNSIAPRAPGPPGDRLWARGGEGRSRNSPASVGDSFLGDPERGAQTRAADAADAAAAAAGTEVAKGPIGVLVVAERGQIEAALRDFRVDLAATVDTAGVLVADAAPLPSATARRLLDRGNAASGAPASAYMAPSFDEMNQPTAKAGPSAGVSARSGEAGSSPGETADAERQEGNDPAPAAMPAVPSPERLLANTDPGAFQVRFSPSPELWRSSGPAATTQDPPAEPLRDAAEETDAARQSDGESPAAASATGEAAPGEAAPIAAEMGESAMERTGGREVRLKEPAEAEQSDPSDGPADKVSDERSGDLSGEVSDERIQVLFLFEPPQAAAADPVPREPDEREPGRKTPR